MSSGAFDVRKLGRLGLRPILWLTRVLVGVPERPRRLPRWSWLTRTDEKGWGFALLFALPYLGYLLWGHAHHEPWRDETHPWIIARQAEGFWDILMGDRRYDGHPPGWYWALWLFSFVTHQVWGLHAVTILFNLGAALLFLRFAPFARPLRLLLVSGYFFAYEYGVLSRNYTLGLFFAFAFASLLKPLRPRPFLLALMLIGLAWSSVYGAILACSLLLVLLAENTSLRGQSAAPGVLGFAVTRRAVVAALVVLAFVGFALWSCHPPDPNPYAPGVTFAGLGYPGFEASLIRMAWSILPLRVDGDIWYWVTADQVWRDHPELFRGVIRGLPVVLLLCLASSPIELVAFLLGAAAIAFIQLTVYTGAIRHWGHYFILFLTLCWTARQRKPLRRGWLVPLVLTVIGACQLESAWVATKMDTTYPFSGGPEAATRLQQPDLARLPLVGGPDWAMPAVTADLERNFISCETQEVNQTLVFHGRRRFCSPFELLRKAADVSERNGGSPVAVVTVGSLPSSNLTAQAELLLRTRAPSLTGEDFAVYRVSKKKPSPAAQTSSHAAAPAAPAPPVATTQPVPAPPASKQPPQQQPASTPAASPPPPPSGHDLRPHDSSR